METFKKEQYETKRLEKMKMRERSEIKRGAKRIAKTAFVFVGIAAGIGVLWWYFVSRPPVAEAEIISHNGLHWHAELSVLIDGKKESIPAGVGLGISHNPIHTHELDNVIHMEMNGVVRNEDLKLGKFFEVWGKRFDKDCILDFCNSDGGSVKISVNGQPNADFGNYVMRDGDRIEIRYEKGA